MSFSEFWNEYQGKVCQYAIVAGLLGIIGAIAYENRAKIFPANPHKPKIELVDPSTKKLKAQYYTARETEKNVYISRGDGLELVANNIESNNPDDVEVRVNSAIQNLSGQIAQAEESADDEFMMPNNLETEVQTNFNSFLKKVALDLDIALSRGQCEFYDVHNGTYRIESRIGGNLAFDITVEAYGSHISSIIDFGYFSENGEPIVRIVRNTSKIEEATLDIIRRSSVGVELVERLRRHR